MGTSNQTSSVFGLQTSNNSIMADKVLEEVAKVDRSSMTHVATEEKNVLPNAEAIATEKKHEDFKAGIAGFDKKSQLKKSNTIEKNTLPSKEDIEAEKAA